MVEKSIISKIIKGSFKYIIPLAITIGLCYVLFTGVNMTEMLQTLKGCDFRWIGLAMFISIFSHVFRAMRWSYQLKALGVNPPLYILIYSIFGTYAVNLVLPRMGEVWRSGYIANRQGAQFSNVFGSMVAERVVDLLLVLILAAVTFFFAREEILDFISEYPALYNLITSPYVWGACVVMLLILWWMLTRDTKNPFIAKIKNMIKGVWDGFAVVATMKGKLPWLILSLLIWGCYFFQLYVAFFAFPETENVIRENGIIAVLVCFVFSSLSMGIPSNGGLGPWQIVVIFGLSLYGAPYLPSFTFANLVIGTQTLLIILLGIVTFIAISLDKKRNA